MRGQERGQERGREDGGLKLAGHGGKRAGAGRPPTTGAGVGKGRKKPRGGSKRTAETKKALDRINCHPLNDLAATSLVAKEMAYALLGIKYVDVETQAIELRSGKRKIINSKEARDWLHLAASCDRELASYKHPKLRSTEVDARLQGDIIVDLGFKDVPASKLGEAVEAPKRRSSIWDE